MSTRWVEIAAAAVALTLLVLVRPVELPLRLPTPALVAALAPQTAGGLALALDPCTTLTGWRADRGFAIQGGGAARASSAAIPLGRARPLPPGGF